MESKKLVNFESGTIVKYFVVKNKVEVESTQFKRQQVETGESIFVRQTAEAWNALGKLPSHIFKNINTLFKTCMGSTPQKLTEQYSTRGRI